MVETKVTERERILNADVQLLPSQKVLIVYHETDMAGNEHDVRSHEMSLESARNFGLALLRAVDTIVQQHSDTIDQSPHAKVRDVIVGRY